MDKDGKAMRPDRSREVLRSTLQQGLLPQGRRNGTGCCSQVFTPAQHAAGCPGAGCSYLRLQLNFPKAALNS